MTPTFFKRPADFRAWLERNHESASELLVGYYKRATGKPSITWPESVDEALCFGWIDGIRRSIDDECYSIRFTPRRPGSIWSQVNTRRMAELIKQKRVRPPGLKAFESRDAEKTRLYSFERETAVLPPDLEKTLRANKKAWQFLEAQPPGYKKIAMFFVVSAKRDETRKRRLDYLIKVSAKGMRLGPTGPTKPGQRARPKRSTDVKSDR